LLKKASILGLQARYNVSSEILLQLNIVAEMGSSEAVKEAVIACLGMSVLSLHAVKREIEQGIIVEITIQGWRIVRQVYLIYRHQLGIMKHHQLFLDYVRESRVSADDITQSVKRLLEM
jgi:DNA-binding transcriptional LysR family regulator